jgi:hypothetical protein
MLRARLSVKLGNDSRGQEVEANSDVTEAKWCGG